MGSVKAALDRALKIQLWNEVIVCYNRLNLKHKSAEVILQQIQEKGESAHLFCLLVSMLWNFFFVNDDEAK